MNQLAEKWYRRLGFSRAYDSEFALLLERVDLSEVPTEREQAIAHLVEKKDFGLNLIYFLTKCEELYEACVERGIPEEIFLATARDLVGGADICMRNFGIVGICEPEWEYNVIVDKAIYRIGRLNFEMHTADAWAEGTPVCRGEGVLSVHIPGTEKFFAEDCVRSMEEARSFLAKYFPEFSYRYTMCASWMMYGELHRFLREDSNILAFQRLFPNRIKTVESNALLKFVFGYQVTPENIGEFEPKSSLQTKVREHVLSGGKTYWTYALQEE